MRGAGASGYDGELRKRQWRKRTVDQDVHALPLLRPGEDVELCNRTVRLNHLLVRPDQIAASVKKLRRRGSTGQRVPRAAFGGSFCSPNRAGRPLSAPSSPSPQGQLCPSTHHWRSFSASPRRARRAFPSSERPTSVAPSSSRLRARSTPSSTLLFGLSLAPPFNQGVISRVSRNAPSSGAALHAGVSRAGVSAGPRVRRAPRRMVPGSAVLRTKPRTEDHASIECPLCLRVEHSGAFQTPNSKLQSWKILENLGKLVQARQTSGVAGISGEKVQRQW